MVGNTSLRRRTQLAMVGVAVLALALQVGMTTWLDVRQTASEVQDYRDEHFQRHHQRVKDEVRRAIFYLEHVLGPGDKPEPVKTNLALDYLERLRFGSDDILFAQDWSQGRAISLLGSYARGVDVTEVGTRKAVEIVELIVDSARKGGGFVKYHYSDRLTAERRLKVSYVAPMTRWNWVIGAGVYVPDIESAVRQREAALSERVQRRVTYALLLMAMLAAIIWLGSAWATRRLNEGLQRFSRFFEAAATENVEIDVDQLAVAELQPAAEAANAMLANRRQMEDAARQAEKMDAVGELAGGVAHDFNNLLTIVMAAASDIESNHEPGTGVRENAEMIQTAATRAAELTKQLLSFSRRGRLQSAVLDMHTLIEEVATLLGRSVDPRISIETQLGAIGHNVEGDPTQLQSCLLNLCVNARDALADTLAEGRKGRIRIETADLQLPEGQTGAGGQTLTPGDYIQIKVIDNGVGMSEAVISRIYEPFFTTKAQGQGTGLGLAGVYGCVLGHEGDVQVQSEPGQGTEFTILLRTSEGEAPTVAPRGARLEGEGSGLILVAEDEEMLRTLISRHLNRLGYKTLVCSDGRRALELYKEHHENLSLVIMDLMMPVLDGEGALAELLQINDAVPVIVCSGFGHNDQITRLLEAGARSFLPKPFEIGDLTKQVRDSIRVGPRGSAGSTKALDIGSTRRCP